MIASIKLELWYLNTPEMLALIEQEGQLRAQGVMLSLFACLRLSHNAVGHRRMLNKLAHDCQCSADWLWHVVTDYGLFEYGADETFYSPYLSKTLGIGRKRTPSNRRARYNARYVIMKIMIITKIIIIIKKKKPMCVCLTTRTRQGRRTPPSAPLPTRPSTRRASATARAVSWCPGGHRHRRMCMHGGAWRKTSGWLPASIVSHSKGSTARR